MIILVFIIAASKYMNTERQTENIVFIIFEKETTCNIKSKIIPLFNLMISLS